MSVPEDGDNINSGRRFGKATWIIVGVIAVLAIVFGVVAVFGSDTDQNKADNSTGQETETAQESSTSGPGHNTTSTTEPPTFSDSPPALNPPGSNSTGKVPDTELTYGRETSTVGTPPLNGNATQNP
ncbi:MAG TPA: hypothetical protein VJP79_09210 [Nitrososphaera sp.]|nr:hypothetical protein [Nitrososphaera sp.]